MARMEPFRVRWAFREAIAEPSHPIHLDSLLARARVDQAIAAGGADEAALTRASQDLPLERQEGPGGAWVWRASQLFLERFGPAQQVTMFRRTDLNDLHARRGVLFESDKTEFPPGTGPFRGFAIPLAVRHIKGATAWGIGDIAAVRSLLQERIPALGKVTRNGWGEIESMAVEPCPDAARLWVCRTLPAWAGAQAGPGHARSFETVRPPYWLRSAREEALAFVGEVTASA